MIGSLYGKLEEKSGRYVILNVGNVGYKVFISGETLSKLPETGSSVKLHTYLYVRENELDLYGFETRGELELFELLIGISGIGPKGALSILSLASPTDIKAAISCEDVKLLTRVSGIGKKTAQKIILELKGKVEFEGIEVKPEELRHLQDALEALVSLGYSQREAREALSHVSREIKDPGEKVKEALKILGQE